MNRDIDEEIGNTLERCNKEGPKGPCELAVRHEGLHRYTWTSVSMWDDEWQPRKNRTTWRCVD